MNFRQLIAFVLGLFLAPSYQVSGQSFCGNTGGFSITPSEGCAPLTVTLKNKVAKAENVTYAYNFDRAQTSAPGQSESTSDSTYTYNLPGTYTILQYGSANGTGFSQCADVVVKETRAPNAELIRCTNGKVRLTLIDDSISNAYDAIIVDWGDGSSQSLSPKSSSLYLDHNYASNSTRPITLKGSYRNADCQQKMGVKTLTGTTPQPLARIQIKSVEMLESGEARILFEGMEGINTEVLIDHGDGQFISTGKTSQTGGTQVATISGLDPKKLYRFKLSSMNICDELVSSPVVSSMQIQEAALALDEIISLSWQNLPNTENLTMYQLKRNGSIIFSSATELSYSDTDVTCGNTYKYEIVAIIENDIRSYSAPVTLEPKTSVPGVINRASVTVQDNRTIATQVALSGEGLTSSYDLVIERALLGSSAFQQVSAPNNQSLQFFDTNVDPTAASYCYRFRYENACNQKSPDFSSPVCSILLSSKAPEIVWSAESPFTEAVSSYDLHQLDEQGNIQAIISKELSTAHILDLSKQSSYSYRVEAQSANGSMTSYSNILQFRSEPIILVPDAFTPNGDTHNERFEIKGYFISKFEMSIFDRWGEVVYHTSDLSGSWDGKVNSKEAAGGYYIYQINATDNSGQKLERKGSFLLIR
ncbi:T9SS type B sorting domain-containing protein [Dyadobacter crusticola]|uniref:T9SS type B sorting domain-containing protein n=1 Tax=Dyadobacter crusticola TaxID=292407 RepID=UPI000A06F2BE|nr:gliding motility-associated C-terminal domain-containing protein [Dyadobacter crusticola]